MFQKIFIFYFFCHTFNYVNSVQVQLNLQNVKDLKNGPFNKYDTRIIDTLNRYKNEKTTLIQKLNSKIKESLNAKKILNTKIDELSSLGEMKLKLQKDKEACSKSTEALRNERDVFFTEIELLKRELHRKIQEVVALKKDREHNNKLLKNVLKIMKVLRTQIAKTKEELTTKTTIITRLTQEVEEKMTEIKRVKQTASGKINEIQESNDNLKMELDRLKKQCEDHLTDNRDLKIQNEMKSRRLEMKIAELDKKQEEYENANKLIDKLSKELEHVRSKVKEREIRLELLENDRRSKMTELTSAKSELQKKSLQLASLQGILITTNSKLDSIKKSHDMKKLELEKTLNLLDESSKKLESTEKTLRELKNKIDDRRKDIRSMQILEHVDKTPATNSNPVTQVVVSDENPKKDSQNSIKPLLLEKYVPAEEEDEDLSHIKDTERHALNLINHYKNKIPVSPIKSNQESTSQNQEQSDFKLDQGKNEQGNLNIEGTMKNASDQVSSSLNDAGAINSNLSNESVERKESSRVETSEKKTESSSDSVVEKTIETKTNSDLGSSIKNASDQVSSSLNDAGAINLNLSNESMLENKPANQESSRVETSEKKTESSSDSTVENTIEKTMETKMNSVQGSLPLVNI
ncbi:hypothetical protein TKK_0001735 [Trichogramma kaykai]